MVEGKARRGEGVRHDVVPHGDLVSRTHPRLDLLLVHLLQVLLGDGGEDSRDGGETGVIPCGDLFSRTRPCHLVRDDDGFLVLN